MEAVKRVYRHGSGAGVKEICNPKEKARLTARKDKLETQRRALGEQFRKKYQSSTSGQLSNAIPHFIGVWDTVAAVRSNPAGLDRHKGRPGSLRNFVGQHIRMVQSWI